MEVWVTVGVDLGIGLRRCWVCRSNRRTSFPQGQRSCQSGVHHQGSTAIPPPPRTPMRTLRRDQVSAHLIQRGNVLRFARRAWPQCLNPSSSTQANELLSVRVEALCHAHRDRLESLNQLFRRPYRRVSESICPSRHLVSCSGQILRIDPTRRANRPAIRLDPCCPLSARSARATPSWAGRAR
jgi:hypothetical protein